MAMDNWLPKPVDDFLRRHPVVFAVALLAAALAATPFILGATQAAIVLYQAF
jgi:hypothetical protein